MTKTRDPRPSRAARSSTTGQRISGRPRLGVLVGLAVVVLGGLLVLVAVRSTDGPPDQVDGGTAGVTGPDFHSLVADLSTPGRLYVGGHQAVSTSNDAGKTWTRVESLDDADAMGWGFRDGAPFVSGHPGLNRSDDGGATFRLHRGVSLVEIAPEDSDFLYAGTHEDVAVRVQVSRDGGQTWAAA